MTHFHYVDDTHIRVDATNGNSEHAIEIRVRENNKSDQITHGEDPSEETCLNGTTNKSVEDRIRLLETSSGTGEDDDQSN